MAHWLKMNSTIILKRLKDTLYCKGVKITVFLFACILASAYISFKNYLLFHSIVELFSIIIAFSVFIMAINTYNFSNRKYFLFLGIAYAFVGSFDLLHTMSYKGINIVAYNNSNLPTQLWIIARYMESFSLLISFIVLDRKVKPFYIFICYSLTSALLLILLFMFPIFPDCFIEGSGLTFFKIASEYVICVILITSMFILKLKKDEYRNHNLYRHLMLSLITTIISELLFTLYADVYGITNMFGHIFKVISFYFIYKAVTVSGTIIPYSLLNQAKEELEMKNLKLESALEELKHKKELEKKALEDEQLLKETLEYDRLKTEFFSNISHELKTPLNVILGTVQLLDLYLKTDIEAFDIKNTNRHIKVVRQNCYRLLRLINNLIDITRIDSGFLKVYLRNCNIVNVVEDITQSVADYIESKGISLIFDTDTEEKILACDPDNIERVILNLLSNAIKFTEPGGTIEVSIFDKEDKVLISVRDTGIGIPEDKLKIIFERFRQVENILSRSHEGSGIGLSLVKSIVEMHSGKISVKSECGKGSEFIIELPVHVLPESEDELKNNYALMQQSNIERINIEFSDIYLEKKSIVS